LGNRPPILDLFIHVTGKGVSSLKKKCIPLRPKSGPPPKFLGNGAIKIDFTPSAPPKIDPMHKYGYILKRASFFQHTIRILGHVVKCRVIGQKARDPPPRADYRAIF
jgi:hypothetical protein